ncbi:MAG: tagaturonate reductase [Firmicutes bacterium]|nr:tagaturonate reductase [Bacillota bacterium]
MTNIQSKFTKKARPVRVLQYGEGNFLRGFVDDMIDIANEKGLFDGNIVLVKPIAFGSLQTFREQDCLYTVSLRGRENGERTVQNRVITSVADAVDAQEQYEAYAAYAKLDTLRFIVSNTTEAGIVYSENDEFAMCPPASYPGKLTKFLYERAEHFQYEKDKGIIILPVELIDGNGVHLKDCVHRLACRWRLGERFLRWLDGACVFASTLVDRIVTGYPADEAAKLWAEWGYEDRLIVTGEPFALWVIESERDISRALPLHEAGLPVIFTDNQKPYKQRKVRILNGAHTAFALAAYLCGHNTVLESMGDPLILDFIRKTLWEEIIPTLTLPKEELDSFANAVLERFSNPFVHHLLLSISLNSVSKWRARCMPSLLDYLRIHGKVPCHLAFSLAALIAFDSGGHMEDGALVAARDGEPYRVLDDENVLRFFLENHKLDTSALARRFLSNIAFFGQDLTLEPGLEGEVSQALADIRALGMRAALEKRFGEGVCHA